MENLCFLDSIHSLHDLYHERLQSPSLKRKSLTPSPLLYLQEYLENRISRDSETLCLTLYTHHPVFPVQVFLLWLESKENWEMESSILSHFPVHSGENNSVKCQKEWAAVAESDVRSRAEERHRWQKEFDKTWRSQRC